MLLHKISVRKPGATEQTEVLKHTVGLSESRQCHIARSYSRHQFLDLKNGGNDVNFSRLCRLEIREKKKQKNKKEKTHHPAHNSCSMNSVCSYVCGGSVMRTLRNYGLCYDIFFLIPIISRCFLSIAGGQLWSLFLILKKIHLFLQYARDSRLMILLRCPVPELPFLCLENH